MWINCAALSRCIRQRVSPSRCPRFALCGANLQAKICFSLALYLSITTSKRWQEQRCHTWSKMVFNSKFLVEMCALSNQACPSIFRLVSLNNNQEIIWYCFYHHCIKTLVNTTLSNVNGLGLTQLITVQSILTHLYGRCMSIIVFHHVTFMCSFVPRWSSSTTRAVFPPGSMV